MTKPSSIPDRVTELERQLPKVARKADEAVFLARKADEDVADFSSKLDVHKTLIEALRETQIEQGKEMRECFGKVGAEFNRLEREMREGFSVLGVGMAQITALLTIAEERSDEP